MYDVYCEKCDQRILLFSNDILSMHNTSEGPVAYVRCHRDHLLMRSFRAGTTRVVQDFELAC